MEAPQPINILAVDDTAANLQLLTGMLKERGYRVRPVTSGEMALRAIEAQLPDLILLDITMPGMDGFEVCRRIKANSAWADIPVLFISALNDTEDKVKAFQVGGVDYVSKPFQFEEVNSRVHTHLELQRQKRELKKNFVALQELEHLRDSLTHMIVHDMRSPLTAVQLSLEMIDSQMAPDDKDTHTILTGAQQSIYQLLELVSGMLDVSRMEAGKMELHRKMTDIVALAQDAVQVLRPLALGKQLFCNSTEPVPAQVDPDLIRRVISNLLSNALKFTLPGGKVSVTVLRAGNNARVEVKDSGSGIAPEHHQLIFEKFGQVGQRTRVVGSGLGLTFAKMAIDAHRGEIGVISALGQGSTFWFQIPVGPAPATT